MRFKIAFLSILSPFDHRSWSGIPFQIYKQLVAKHDVTWVDGKDMNIWLRRIIKYRNKLYASLRVKHTYHYFLYSYFLNLSVKKKLITGGYDFIVVGGGETPLIASLNIDIPIILIADTTFNNMVDYYPWHSGLSKAVIREGNRIEANAITNSSRLIYTSRWAAKSAIEFYKAEKNKISIIDFGANLLIEPQRQLAANRTATGRCNLLFIGVHWQRKGGDIAYATFKQLQATGFNCSLTIIGCKPPGLSNENDLVIIPFLNKNNADDFERLSEIFAQSDILLLPTRADCTPIVFCEAAAYGLPVITTDTGGVSDVVKDKVSGFCLPASAGPNDYANVLRQLWQNKKQYQQMVANARKEFEERLNWTTWSMKFDNLLFEMKSSVNFKTTVA